MALRQEYQRALATAELWITQGKDSGVAHKDDEVEIRIGASEKRVEVLVVSSESLYLTFIDEAQQRSCDSAVLYSNPDAGPATVSYQVIP